MGTKEQFIRIDGQDCIQYDEHTGLEPSDLTTAYEDYMGATTSFLETVSATRSFEVVLDLRDPDDESAVRGLTTDMTATNLPGYFRAWINKSIGTSLVERQVFFFRYTASRNPGRNQQPHQQPINPDDSGETEPQSDRKMKGSGSDTRGEDSSPQAWPDGISLDHVDGELSPGEISTGQPITFHLRIYNHFFHMRHIVPHLLA